MNTIPFLSPSSLHQKLICGGLSNSTNSLNSFALRLSHFNWALQEASTSISTTFNSLLLGANTRILPRRTFPILFCSYLPCSLRDSLWYLLALLKREKALEAKTILWQGSREAEMYTSPLLSRELTRPRTSATTISV